MRILIYFALLIIGAAFISFIAALIFYELEEHDLKNMKKSDEDYNQKMIQKCIDAVNSGKCNRKCRKCPWNTRMKDGIIEFSKKPGRGLKS